MAIKRRTEMDFPLVIALYTNYEALQAIVRNNGHVL